MKNITLSIITPDGSLFSSEKVDLVIAKSVSGEITLLPRHAPIFTKLVHGELLARIGGKDRLFTIFEGFLNMTDDDEITVLADTAKRADELNIEAIRKAKRDAQKALEEKSKLSATEILRAETAMQRAIMELRVAEKYLKKG